MRRQLLLLIAAIPLLLVLALPAAVFGGVCLARSASASVTMAAQHRGMGAPAVRLLAARGTSSLIACMFKSRICVMRADGKQRHAITRPTADNPGGQDEPAWSPDGERIAYLDYAGVTDGTGCRLWIVNADGSGAYRVNVLGSSESLVLGVTPAWSPDGRRIAFANVMNIHVGNPEKAWQAVFSYDSDTGETTQVYRAPKGCSVEGLTWSADGSTIEFSLDNWTAVQLAQINGRRVRLVSRLRVVNVATHHVTTVATAPSRTYFTGVARSPNGRLVAVALSRQRGSRRAAILTGAMGGRPRRTVVRAVQATTQYIDVSWAPDGKRLAYGIYTPNGHSTWIIGADGRGDHKVLAGASCPAWQPR